MTSDKKRLAQRYRSERVLVWFGKGAMIVALLFLALLLGNVAWTGWRALLRVELALDVHIDEQKVGTDGLANVLAYEKLAFGALRTNFPDETKKRRDRKAMRALLSDLGSAKTLQQAVSDDPSLLGGTTRMWLPASSLAEGYLKGSPVGKISDKQIAVLDRLREEKRTRKVFNDVFFFSGDSRNPELAGIGSALVGSLFALLVAFVVSFPVAVGAAIYLEMFAPKNRFFDLVEININNLAAVPSIIKGLFGLAVFINLFGMPRSSALVGGMVLSLLAFPTIIVASRASLKAVSPSLLHGAMSLGATRLQGVMHHVLPSALPGVLTGTIIGMAHALGETAPLLMIGMVAFVVSIPGSLTDVATALPVQIFLWADQPERGYVERTALAIFVLLVFLLAMNATAIYLRKRLEALR